MINERIQIIREAVRTDNYLCNTCARPKPRPSKEECWCRNKVVRKLYVFEECDAYRARADGDE